MCGFRTTIRHALGFGALNVRLDLCVSAKSVLGLSTTLMVVPVGANNVISYKRKI